MDCRQMASPTKKQMYYIFFISWAAPWVAQYACQSVLKIMMPTLSCLTLETSKNFGKKLRKVFFNLLMQAHFFFKTDFGTRGVTKPNAIPTLMSVHSLLLLGFFGRCGHSFSGPSNRALVSQGFESHLFFIKWKETRQHFFCLTMGGWELNVDTQLVYILKKIQNIVWLHYFFIFPLPLW